MDPSVRERTGGAPGERIGAPAASRELSSRETRDLAEIHQRLDSIARQVEHLSQNPAARGENGVARQLGDAISRLDARLSHMTAPPQQPSYAAAPRMAPPMNSPMAPPAPPTLPHAPGLDLSIAEIIARQGELDGVSAAQDTLKRSAPNFVQAPPMAPGPGFPNFLSIERQIAGITSQIETLRRPDGMEQSIAAFRTELAEIRHAITEALPRRAIESLEGEIRSLGRRIDETHQTGADGTALGAIERALSDIRSQLRALTPAEQLAGFDDAIRHLGGKIDTIVRSSQDPGTLRQLDGAISALKTIVANIASNEALAQLSEHIRTLSQKVDQLSQAGHSDMFAALEQRIAALTSTLEQRERPAADSSHFDNAVRTISDRLDNLQIGGDATSTFTHVEQRVAHLLERLEASETRPGNLGRVETGLSDIMQMLQQRGTDDVAPTRGAPAMDTAFVDTIRRELTDMRQSQIAIDRHTQDSLEVVHNTLGHVVDRLAQIEGDLRQGRPAPAPVSSPVSAPAPQRPAAPPIPPQTRPELPNPALLQSAAQQMSAKAGPVASQLPREPAPANAVPPRPGRSPIDPDLPPDHPLEPGSRGNGRPSAAERIANSESALRDIPQPKGPVSSSNFIQAARRAAQAAQAAEANPKAATKKANRVTALNDAARPAAGAKEAVAETPRSSRVRALLVGASVFVIVLGTFKMASNLWHSGETGRAAPAMESHAVVPPPAPPAQDQDTNEDEGAAPDRSAIEPRSMISPTPIDKQSMNAPAATALPSWASNPSIAPTAQPANPDITGSIPSVDGAVAPLPDAIGGPVLRSAALKGDASAAYEIGLRYAEGRGVTANFEEAAKWYDRAAKANLVPALFRLGTLYEKGLGVAKNMDTANRYYRQAADRGNAKAMHNLAVLEADGGGKPNYKAAVYWFVKAADHGVADSQFNLGILYARGIGVEQNLADSYKWFSLAAAQGDTDSARKRDDVAKRLDPSSLAAAKLAVQNFKVEPQPTEAFQVATPPGGWDAKRVQKSSAKPAKRKPANHAAI